MSVDLGTIDHRREAMQCLRRSLSWLLHAASWLLSGANSYVLEKVDLLEARTEAQEATVESIVEAGEDE